MAVTIQEYLDKVNRRYKSGISREHAYRADLENLINCLVNGVDITNEPSNVTDAGNPDFVITKNKIPIGYIEAKDIGKDLNSKQYNEQFDRYRKALDNLIITDYLWFQFFQNGALVHEIRIGELEGDSVKSNSDNFLEFQNLIQNFCTFIGQTIKSSKKLAGMMAAKARLLENILERAVNSDEESQENSTLKGQYEAFKQVLIHELKPKEFADIYAQTLAYGMFAARLHDKTLNTFSRQEASELIPKTNPFLRKLFNYVAGPDIDERIKPTVDNLAEVFRATDVAVLLQNFGTSTQTNDPIIHFYETFLAEYDPKLRKARGVWYTPEPVVNFIVRSVDEILKTEFQLSKGLADTSKTKIKVNTQFQDKRSSTGYRQEEREVHKVQILDPATGTGTFLAEVVKFIYNTNFKSIQGAWSGFVEEHLIPRLNGFELLMASYSMAHLKLDMLLSETGFKPKKEERFRIYLTNSLEEYHPDTGLLFAEILANEANEASKIKRDAPVMCVIGNPPYSGESNNQGNWIKNLMNDYKKEPGGREKLKEKNSKFINDDYVKFIRFGQYFIEKNGEGVLAFINPHGFLDNPTFRGMRWNLLKTYDKIYTIDLHGNAKKKETSPDGSPDTNVFDIEQGVSINFFVKTGKKKSNELGQVFHYDLYGKRDSKYNFLSSNSISSTNFELIKNIAPNYFFVPKDFSGSKKYTKGFKIDSLFVNSSLGIQTHRDKFIIDINKTELSNRVIELLDSNIEPKVIIEKYNLKESKDFQIRKAREFTYDEKKVTKIDYRPFDIRNIYYDGSLIDRDRRKIMQHMNKPNVSLIISKHQSTYNFQHAFISKHISESCLISIQTKEQGYCFPLYCYSSDEYEETVDNRKQEPNFDKGIINQIAEKLGLFFSKEKKSLKDTFAPIDLLDYIYAVLHSPTYRDNYKEFLKIDFPIIPYPKDKEVFWHLVKLGGEIRKIHLFESPTVEQYITHYPVDGNNLVGKPEYKDSKVYINDTQFFDNVPQNTWEFYIGGYQPAQKWLKDRKDRKLGFDDILHYQKIIMALSETDRLMKEIDKINFLD